MEDSGHYFSYNKNYTKQTNKLNKQCPIYHNTTVVQLSHNVF